MLRDVYFGGVRVPTRAVLQSTGEQVHALSLFGYQWRHDLERGFPLLTTKKIHFRSVVAELIWFLRGSTSVKDLQAMGCHIWDQWADENGELGPTYGQSWRRFRDVPLDSGHKVYLDQIGKAIFQIQQVRSDPFASCGRRIIVSAWDPALIDQMALPPCHYTFQFIVRNGRLNCAMVMRSADAFLGVPFNIASYALLTHLVARETDLEPGELVISFHDLHIYENHLDRVREQLGRQPMGLPSLQLKDGPWTINDVPLGACVLVDYNPHSALKAEVAV